MFSSFFKDKKWALWAYGGAIFIILLLVYQTHLNVRINEWYKNFYDIMQNSKDHNVDEFWRGILNFLKIAMPYVVTYTVISFFASHWVFRWREAMTFKYLKFWRNCQNDIEGSSQRIQEDVYRFAKIMESLGVQVLKAFMTLIAFIPVLWELSKSVSLPFIKDIEGSLVYIALLISIGGLIVSWFVGIKLPHLEYNNQKAEAAFRKELVYGEDDKLKFCQPNVMLELFTGVKLNYYKLFLCTTATLIFGSSRFRKFSLSCLTSSWEMAYLAASSRLASSCKLAMPSRRSERALASLSITGRR